MKRLLIIDGNAVLHRAFHAMPEWRNRSGEATSGVYGFFSMLLRVREDLKPEYLVVAFDMPEPNFRHAMYVGYQSNRAHDEQLSEDIWGQVEKLNIALGKLDVPVYRVPGFEADDVIGTLARQAVDYKIDEAIILTGDRDLLQLVNDWVKVYLPTKGISEGVLLDREGVKEKMGVWPEQIVDYKALVGDPSDGYPGVSGIGPKTAAVLLSEYGNLEEIYQACQRVDAGIKDIIRMKLLGGEEMARMSQKLATIITEVPVELDLGRSAMPKKEKFAELFSEVGHPSLKARVLGEKVEKEPKVKVEKPKQQTSLF